MVLGTNTNSHHENVQIKDALDMLNKYLTEEGKEQFRKQFEKNAEAIVKEYNNSVDRYNEKTVEERKKMIKTELLDNLSPDQTVLKEDFEKDLKEMIEKSLEKSSNPKHPHGYTIQRGGDIDAGFIAGVLIGLVTLGVGLTALHHITAQDLAVAGFMAADYGGSKHKKRKGRKTKKSMKHKKGRKSKKAKKSMKKRKSMKKGKSNKKKKSNKKRK